MHRFYAPQGRFDKENIILDTDETRHLRDVLRFRLGEIVRVFDGEGLEFSCRIEDIGKKISILRIIEKVQPSSPESDLDLTLVVGMLKGEKFDLVVQKAVELGVAKLIPLQTRRCDIQVKDNAKRNERWRKIALEAAKQSGRAKLMRVENPIDFNLYINTQAGKDGILFAEAGGESFSKILKRKKITALIGPEGGWDTFEVEISRRKGVQIITLGGRILRAETAAVSIAAILQHRFGDLN